MNLVREKIKERLANKILNWYEHNPKRIYISIKPQEIKETVSFFVKELKLRFIIATGQDMPEGIEILYHFSYDHSGEIFSLRILLENKKDPQVDSIAPLFAGAEWIEREIWELLGVKFIGHPNLKRLLLSDEWPEGKYPLRHIEG